MTARTAVVADLDNTNNTIAAMIKRLQPQRRIDQLWKQVYPFLSMVKKSDGFEGSQMDIPVEFDGPAASRTFATAQGNNMYPTSSVKFALTRAKDYCLGRVDSETLLASRSNKGAFVKILDRETTNCLMTLRKRTAIGLYRNHGGAIGQISAIANGDGTNDRIALTSKTDIVNFSKGMSFVTAETDGTSGSVQAGNAYVGRLDFENGHIYVVDETGTALTVTDDIAAADANDYLFAEGDFGNSFRGLASWVPTTAPTGSDSFLGVNRSADIMRLSGHRLGDTSLSIEEAIQDMAARIAYSGGQPDYCFMSPIQVKQLALELDTKVVRDPGGKGKTGFSGVMVDTAVGSIEVLGDPACPETSAYVVEMASWEFHHLGGLPHLVEDDGLKSARVSDADQVEFRYRLFGNLACYAPGHNGVITLAAAL